MHLMLLLKKFLSDYFLLINLSVIFIKAELRLQNQREQNREARQLRHKELEKNARDVRNIPLIIRTFLFSSYLINYLYINKKDTTGSDLELNKIDQKKQEEVEKEQEKVIISLS